MDSLLSPCSCVIRNNDGTKQTVQGWAVVFEAVRRLQWTITPVIRKGRKEWTLTEWTTGAHLPINGPSPQAVQERATEYFRHKSEEELVTNIASIQRYNQLLDSGETPSSIRRIIEKERQKKREKEKKLCAA